MPDAIAPYNFVPLPSRIIPAEEEALRPVADRYEETRHTGWFHVEMTALTPLYTRGVQPVSPGFPPPIAQTGRAEQNQVADFFHRGEKPEARECVPMLPGSSLRGMFRTVFEIMTQSRMEFINEHRLFFRYFAARQNYLREYYSNAFQAPDRLVAGILRKRQTAQGQEWFLEVANFVPTGSPPAAFARGFVALPVSSLGSNHVLRRRRSGNDIFQASSQTVLLTGQEVTLLQSPNELTVPEAVLTAPAAAALPGFLILPGTDLNRPPPNSNIPSRSWFQVILDPQLSPGGSREYGVPRAVYGDYDNWGRMAHGQRFTRDNGTAPRRLQDGSPAFALISEDDPTEIAVIGANMMMPLRYEYAMPEVAARSYDSSLPRTDMAQALFGRVPAPSEIETGVEPILGRVFVEDALCCSATWYLDTVDPVRIPAQLLNPKPTAIQMYLEQPEVGALRHWSDPDARARGFKCYWHRTSEDALQELRPNKNELESTETRICPIRPKTQFRGRIRFENLTDRELGGLYATVQLPWDPERSACLAHKFGMGKNLGLGSLQVKVTDFVLFNMQKRYTSFVRPEGGLAGQLTQPEATARLTAAYREFVTAVGKKGQLWQRERTRALANLLSWDPLRASWETRQVGIQTDPKKPDFDADAQQWPNRNALLHAEDYFRNRVVPDVLSTVVASSPAAKDALPPEAVQPPLVQRHSFTVGQEVSVIVTRRFGSAQGDVSLDDGTPEGRTLRNVKVGASEVNETVTMIVASVNADGLVTGLRRP